MSVSPNAIADNIYTNLMHKPPTTTQQAKMLVDAMQEYLNKDIRMDIKTVNDKYVSFTGATHDTKNLKDYAVVGRFAEVAMYDGVNEYFKIEEVRDRYGMWLIQGTANVMIPADALKAGQTRDYTKQILHPLIKRAQEIAFRGWKKAMPDSKSMADFFMKDALPLEVKGKIDSYIFVEQGKQTQHAPSNRNKLTSGNEHLKQVKNMGGRMMVGGIWVDTVWHDVTEDLEPFKDFEEETIRALSSKSLELGKEKGGLTLKYDWELPKKAASKHGKGKLFQMVELRMNAFIPMVADKRKLVKIIKNKYITRSDMNAIKASSEFVTDELLKLVKAYENKISAG